MKIRLTRMLLSMVLSSCFSLAWAAPALTGYDSANTIPYSLFDETDNDKPWIKSAPSKTAPLRPATQSHLQEKQRIEALQHALNEQQRINKELAAGHHSEKQALEAQIATLKRDQSLAQPLREDVERLQRVLTSAKSENDMAAKQIAELRALMQSHQLLADNHAIKNSLLNEQLEEKEQNIKDLSKQLDELKVSRQQQVAESLSAETRQQSRIAELQQALNQAQQQKANAEAQLDELRLARSAVKPESQRQKLSYANGVAFADNIVNSLRMQQELGMDADRPMVLAGIQDAFDKKIAMNSEEISKLVAELDLQLNEKLSAQQQQRAHQAAEQRKLGKKLRAKTLQRKGVKEKDGVLYVVTEKGMGKKITPESTVRILLTGRLADGTVFDNSGSEKKVQQVKVKELLPAITETLTQLNEGAQVEIVLPPEKAFGQKGMADIIPGDATLQFDIKILKE